MHGIYTENAKEKIGRKRKIGRKGKSNVQLIQRAMKKQYSDMLELKKKLIDECDKKAEKKVS